MKFWYFVIKNIALALAIVLVLVFMVMLWLNIYTSHGRQVSVPDVKGMQVEQAAPFFKQRSLQYIVMDSIFIRNKPAGSILETTPPAETHVKEGRIIYLTVNSATAQLLIVPQVTEMSRRKAESTLRLSGFETIRIQSRPGPFFDYVVGLETTGGDPVVAGSRLRANTPLVLLVGSGVGETPIPETDEMPSEDSDEYEY